MYKNMVKNERNLVLISYILLFCNCKLGNAEWKKFKTDIQFELARSIHVRLNFPIQKLNE